MTNAMNTGLYGRVNPGDNFGVTENFSGGTEGQELTLHFGNGNTTIKATTIYTPSAGAFVGTAADVMRLIYSNGAWRTISTSVN